jgi:hypothetical protein
MIPSNTRGSTREEEKEPIKLGKNQRTVGMSAGSRGLSAKEGADCPKDRARTVRSTKVTFNRKTPLLSKRSAKRSARGRGLSASRGLSAKHAPTVLGRTTKNTMNPQEHLPKVVPRSPKWLKLLSKDLGEMICVTR